MRKNKKEMWAALNRPNVLIKVPATSDALPAIRQPISEGINVNVTPLFVLPRYRQVAEACIAGLETCHTHTLEWKDPQKSFVQGNTL